MLEVVLWFLLAGLLQEIFIDGGNNDASSNVNSEVHRNILSDKYREMHSI